MPKNYFRNRLNKMQKAGVYTSNEHGVPGWNRPEHERGVNAAVKVTAPKFAGDAKEQSLQGVRVRRGDSAGAKKAARGIIAEQRSMPKPTLKSENLQKTPFETPKDEAANYGSKPILVSPVDFKHGYSKKLQNGLYHHYFNKRAESDYKVDDRFPAPDDFHLHVISQHQNPWKKGASLLEVAGNEEGQVWGAKASPEHAGKGYGKLAYLAAIAHHKNLFSGNRVSGNAMKAWQALPGITEDSVSFSIAKPNTHESNSATVTNHKKLIQSLYSSGPEISVNKSENYFRNRLEQLNKALSPTHPKIALRDWDYKPDPAKNAAHFSHRVHGVITVRPNTKESSKTDYPFVAMHNGASIGRFKTTGEAALGVAKYAASLGTQPITRLHNVDPMGMKTQKGEKEGRCWEGYEPTPGKKPYSKGSCKPKKKMAKEETKPLGQPASPGINPQAASQVQAGATWSPSQTMAHYKRNLMAGLGINKAEFFRAMIELRKDDQPYNPKLVRPNQRERVKTYLEAEKKKGGLGKINVSTTNAKLNKDRVASFNLPAVETCPGAGDCAKFCYADTGSFLRFHKTTMPPRIQNWLAAQKADFVDSMAEEINKYHKKGMKALRIHDSGDFFSPDYIDKWIQIAKKVPHVPLYAYTKSHHPKLREKLNELESLPNVNIVQSFGSKYDHLIDHNKPHAVIFPDKDSMLKAGYADAMETDLTAADKNNKKVGLYIHGQAGGQYKGLEDHLKDHPTLLADIMAKLKK